MVDVEWYTDTHGPKGDLLAISDQRRTRPAWPSRVFGACPIPRSG